MNTIQQIHVSTNKNKILAIVECNELYEFDREMLKRVKDKYAVINFFNFNEGFKDNIEGITVIGILTYLDMAKIVFSVEFQKQVKTVIVEGRKKGSNHFAMTAIMSGMNSSDGLITTCNQGENAQS